MRTTHIRSAAAAAVALAVLAAALVGAPAHPAHASGDAERQFYELANQARAANGLGALQYDPNASAVARQWSEVMASSGSLRHNPNLVGDVEAYVTTGWSRLGENIGVGYGVNGLHSALMSSAPHRANILGNFNRVGVGVFTAGDGRLWATQVFLLAPALAHHEPPAPPPVYPYQWLLRDRLGTGQPNYYFPYAPAGTQVLRCDWDGDGIDTPAFVQGNVWGIHNANTSAYPELVFTYGPPSWKPICGDWNGDGIDTIGAIADGNVWALRNSNSYGYPDVVFSYGPPTWKPVVGDWNGDGIDTAGAIADGNVWALRNSNSYGYPDVVFSYGPPTWKPVAGDWNGDGIDTAGAIADGNVWALRNSNSYGYPDVVFSYGMRGWIPMAGDWNGDGRDSQGMIGV